MSLDDDAGRLRDALAATERREAKAELIAKVLRRVYADGRRLGRQEGAAGMRLRAAEACESIQGRACAELVRALDLDPEVKP